MKRFSKFTTISEMEPYELKKLVRMDVNPGKLIRSARLFPS